MKVVLDANVIVSAAYTFEIPGSIIAQVLRMGIRSRYSLLTSAHIMHEVEMALAKPFFAERLAPGAIDVILDGLRDNAIKVELTQQVQGVATHWQDDLVLATALSGKAEYLVTGDRELLDLDHPYDFVIIHPNAFLAVLDGDTW